MWPSREADSLPVGVIMRLELRRRWDSETRLNPLDGTLIVVEDNHCCRLFLSRAASAFGIVPSQGYRRMIPLPCA